MIYAIQRGEDGPVKFGVADAPRKRLKELQTACAEKLILQAFADLPKEQEALIHHFCREDRLMGEWFKPTRKVLDLIEVIRRQAMFPKDHVLTNYIYEVGFDSLVWHRRQLGLKPHHESDFNRWEERREMKAALLEAAGCTMNADDFLEWGFDASVLTKGV